MSETSPRPLELPEFLDDAQLTAGARARWGLSRFARMAGSSIAGRDAAPWVTGFLNAAYLRRPTAGAAGLLGPWFPEAYADDRRRGWGIAFGSAGAQPQSRVGGTWAPLPWHIEQTHRLAGRTAHTHSGVRTRT